MSIYESAKPWLDQIQANADAMKPAPRHSAERPRNRNHHHRRRRLMDVFISSDIANATEEFPLYLQYEGQYRPQYAAITLDLRDGEIGFYVSTEIGNGRPADIFHGVRRAYTVTPCLSRERLECLIEKHIDDFQAIMDDSDVQLNFSGNYVGKLGDDAEDIERHWNCHGIDRDVIDIAMEEWEEAQANA